MFSNQPMNHVRIEEACQQHIEMLTEAIALQTAANEITERKILALQDKLDALKRVHTELSEIASTEGNHELSIAYLDLRLAESCLIVVEREQTELCCANELRSLKQMKAELEQVKDPNFVTGVRFNR